MLISVPYQLPWNKGVLNTCRLMSDHLLKMNPVEHDHLHPLHPKDHRQNLRRGDHPLENQMRSIPLQAQCQGLALTHPPHRHLPHPIPHHPQIKRCQLHHYRRSNRNHYRHNEVARSTRHNLLFHHNLPGAGVEPLRAPEKFGRAKVRTLMMFILHN